MGVRLHGISEDSVILETPTMLSEKSWYWCFEAYVSFADRANEWQIRNLYIIA